MKNNPNVVEVVAGYEVGLGVNVVWKLAEGLLGNLVDSLLL